MRLTRVAPAPIAGAHPARFARTFWAGTASTTISAPASAGGRVGGGPQRRRQRDPGQVVGGSRAARPPRRRPRAGGRPASPRRRRRRAPWRTWSPRSRRRARRPASGRLAGRRPAEERLRRGLARTSASWSWTAAMMWSVTSRSRSAVSGFPRYAERSTGGPATHQASCRGNGRTLRCSTSSMCCGPQLAAGITGTSVASASRATPGTGLHGPEAGVAGDRALRVDADELAAAERGDPPRPATAGRRPSPGPPGSAWPRSAAGGCRLIRKRLCLIRKRGIGRSPRRTRPP